MCGPWWLSSNIPKTWITGLLYLSLFCTALFSSDADILKCSNNLVFTEEEENPASKKEGQATANAFQVLTPLVIAGFLALLSTTFWSSLSSTWCSLSRSSLQLLGSQFCFAFFHPLIGPLTGHGSAWQILVMKLFALFICLYGVNFCQKTDSTVISPSTLKCIKTTIAWNHFDQIVIGDVTVMGIDSCIFSHFVWNNFNEYRALDIESFSHWHIIQ